MKTQQIRNSRARSVTVAALLIAGLGIVAQILAGAEYPAVPPGLVILIATALLVARVPWRWTPAIAAVISLFLTIGLFAAGRSSALIHARVLADAIGLWIQTIAIGVAFIASIAALRRPARKDL